MLALSVLQIDTYVGREGKYKEDGEMESGWLRVVVEWVGGGMGAKMG